MLLPLLIFAATYLVVALGHLPGWRLDRAGAALIGASLMVASGTLSLPEAYHAINFDTLTLLLGMMIVVAQLRLAGFFGLAARLIARHARYPLLLLIGIVLVAGVLSAFLVNDTVCLMLTPLVAEAVLALRRNPLPYLLAVDMAFNIGSVATITGNPQNMMIGSLSQITYGSFAAHLAPVAALGLGVATVLIALAFRDEILTRTRLPDVVLKVRWNAMLLTKALVATLAMVAFFFLGKPPAEVAIVAGALLLPTRRIKPERIYREIDWSLLLLFAGLFIVVAGMEKAALTPAVRAAVGSLALDRPPILALVTAVLGNLVSNVPAVMVLSPFITALGDPRTAWLVLAMAATLAGNFTILGSIANLIVVQRAARYGITISFSAYFRIGAPLTVLTILIGVWLVG